MEYLSTFGWPTVCIASTLVLGISTLFGYLATTEFKGKSRDYGGALIEMFVIGTMKITLFWGSVGFILGSFPICLYSSYKTYGILFG